jgi:hypothetical protein
MKTAETTAPAPPGQPKGCPCVVLDDSSRSNLFLEIGTARIELTCA